MYPWELNDGLSADRLITIAQLIQRGRNKALDRFDSAIGCSPWTVGCEAFAFQKHEIVQAAVDYDWLEILDGSMQFVFAIDHVPVRFYRGEPDEPSTRTLRQTFPELLQLSLFSAEELARLGNGRLYRFAVETDFDGSLTAISFVVLDGEVPILAWPIPLDGTVSKIAPLWGEKSEGVELPAPAVGIAKARNDNDEAAGA
jgi:hypothetical protein